MLKTGKFEQQTVTGLFDKDPIQGNFKTFDGNK